MASNEEVMSINEELQSTNEELETSKEELQSLNEEILTVNMQLASKVDELEIKHADLENLIAATDVATVCLGTDLSIRWFTPATRELIRIKPADIGRPVHDLQNDFVNDDLVEECEQVVRKLIPTDSEVDCIDGRTFIRRVIPYRTDDDRIGGVVITLIDITSLRKREEELRVSEGKLRELNKTLEQKVVQRTELLSILQHTTKIANEAKSVEEAMRAAMANLAIYNSWRVGHVWQRSDELAERGEPLQDSSHPTTAEHTHADFPEQDRTPRSAIWVSTGIWHINEEFRHLLTGFDEFQRLTEQMTMNVDEGVVGRVITSGQPRQVRDITEHQDTPRSCIAGLKLHGAIAFPITIDREVVAIIEFFSEQLADLEPALLEILPDIGIQLGRVIQRKHLEQLITDIANEEEKRIGRELHDGIAQQLTGGALIAEALRKSLPDEMAAQIDNVDHLIDILQETHNDVSRLSRGLMPDAIAAADLLPALRGLVAETKKRFGIDVTLITEKYDESFIRVDTTAATIYQVARESLHNALKHSGSDAVDVEVSTTKIFSLVVRDHGDGFDMRETIPKANGLRIMRYRTEAIGGELTIQSAEGKGTQVTLTIPRTRCQS